MPIGPRCPALIPYVTALDRYLINLLTLNLNYEDYLPRLTCGRSRLTATRFGDDSPPNRRLNCAGFCHNWPPPSPQSTTTASIPKSQYSPKRTKTEPQNDGIRPLPSSSSFLK